MSDAHLCSDQVPTINNEWRQFGQQFAITLLRKIAIFCTPRAQVDVEVGAGLRLSDCGTNLAVFISLGNDINNIII